MVQNGMLGKQKLLQLYLILELHFHWPALDGKGFLRFKHLDSILCCCSFGLPMYEAQDDYYSLLTAPSPKGLYTIISAML